MSGLSDTHIVRRALRLIDKEGLTALSMRRLGQELGVDAKAIYYYFPNKEALMAAVLKAAFSEMALPETLSGSWPAQLRQIMAAYTDLVGKHPHLLPYLIQFDGSIEVVFGVIERIVVALKPTGLPPHGVVQVIALLTDFLPSAALSAKPRLDQAKVFEQLRRLPAATYPATRALLEHLQPADLEPDDDFVPELLILAIETLIKSHGSR